MPTDAQRVPPAPRGQQAFLGPGMRCQYDGHPWTVQSWDGTYATLVDDGGSTVEALLWDLVHEHYDSLQQAAEDRAREQAQAKAEHAAREAGDAPGNAEAWTAPAETDLDDAGAAALLLSLLPPGDRAAVDAMAEHMEEIRTGYRRGGPALALPGEPRADYRPGVSDRQRFEAKGAEIGLNRTQVMRKYRDYKKHGPAALIKKGFLKGSSPLLGCDARFLTAVRDVCGEHVRLSTVGQAVVLAAVKRHLATVHGAGVVPVPRKTKAYAVLNAVGRPMGLFGGVSSKTRMNMANGPVGTYGSLVATRPGEYVLLDSTVLDVFAMDRRTGKWVRLELTVAIDLFTRSIVAMRLTPFTTKATDVAGLLYDCVRPKAMRPGWSNRAAWRYHGLPANLVVDVTRLADEDGAPLAGVPFVALETIVIDHGKIYISNLVRSVCRRMGISIQPARPYTPTDKAVVERWFLTLRTGLLQSLKGYKGPDVYSRGKNAEGGAFYFVDELENILWEWVATIHQNRPQKGLVMAEDPRRPLTPNEAHELGIQRAGFVAIPAREDLAFEFLPIRWLGVRHDGIEIDSLRYNGDVLRDARGVPGPRPQEHGTKWPVWVDAGDLRQVWFRDPTTGRIGAVPWEHAEKVPAPFTDDMLREAKRRIVAEHRDPADLHGVLAEMLASWDAGLATTAVERKMAVRAEQKARAEKAAKATARQVAQAFPSRHNGAEEPEAVPERTPPAAAKAGPARLVAVPAPAAVELGDDDAAELDSDDQVDADVGFYDDVLEVF